MSEPVLDTLEARAPEPAAPSPVCDAPPELHPYGEDEPANSPLPLPEERPCFIVFDEWTEAGGRKMRPGVWWCTMTRGSKHEEPQPYEVWICGPLHIDAQTRGDDGSNFGRLLRFQTSTGEWTTWAMPQELLAGDGTELRAELLYRGLELDPDRRKDLNRYLTSRTPRRVIRCADRIGWVDDRTFCLPDRVIGRAAGEVVFQWAQRGTGGHGERGTLEGWRDAIARPVAANPMLAFAISAAFAGPMLARIDAEGGGCHLFGDSSIGKSAALAAAASVWGGPDFRRSWRSTSNGLEAVAVLHNDLLLPLDEISEADPRTIGEVAYLLANGQAKARMTRAGGARPARRWRTFILSTGETTLAAHMLRVGQRAQAGQAVRLLEVPALRRYGIFDDLAGFESGRALADHLRTASERFHGVAGRVFLARLVADRRDFGALYERAKALPDFAAAPGQEARAAARFALVGLAGELAAEYGVTGWPDGVAMRAAVEAYAAWRNHRGARGQAEPARILEAIRDFIDRHGEARFDPVDGDGPPARDRAGWRRGTEYLFTPAGLREATCGFDLERALDVLEEAGLLARDVAGKRSERERVGGVRRRVYVIDAAKLAEALGDER